MSFKTAVSILVSVLLAGSAAAQPAPGSEKGFSADKIYRFEGIDQVQTFNGGLSINLPIGSSYPLGGGLSYQLIASYSSKVFDFEEVVTGNGLEAVSIPSRKSNAGLSWTVSMGRLIPPDDPANESGLWIYETADQAEHVLFSTLHPGDEEDGFRYSRDGSFLRAAITDLDGSLVSATIEFPNGAIHDFGSNYRPSMIRDLHGNYLKVDYSVPLQWKLDDQYGRSHTVQFIYMAYDGEARETVTEIKVETFGGIMASYGFTYDEDTSIWVACTDHRSNPMDPIPTAMTVPTLSSITLPDGSQYKMTYQTTGQAEDCGQGAIATLQLPTRGSYSYTYGNYLTPLHHCVDDDHPWTRRTPGVRTRTVSKADGTAEGTWTYLQSLSPAVLVPGTSCKGFPSTASEYSTTSVVTPLGDWHRYYYSVWPQGGPDAASPNGYVLREYGLPITRSETDSTGQRFLSTEVNDSCDSYGNNCDLLRKTYVRYEYERPCGEIQGLPCSDSHRRVVSARTAFFDDLYNGTDPYYIDRVYESYDGLGHYRSTRVSSVPGTSPKTTFTNYNPGHDLVVDSEHYIVSVFAPWPIGDPWLINTFSGKSVTENGTTAESQYCFDEGQLIRERIQNGSAPGTHDLVRYYTYHPDGNLWRERFYGGDTQTLSTSSDLCNLTLPGVRYRLDHEYAFGALASTRYKNGGAGLMPFYNERYDIDLSTGLAASSYDVSDVKTEFEYDVLGRLTWVKPAESAWTQYTYIPASPGQGAKVEVRQRPNGLPEGTPLHRQEYHFYSFGRVFQERRLRPAPLGWAERETEYNALGWKTRVSEWTAEGAPRSWTEFLEQDALGRAHRIRPPDGSSHDIKVAYSGNRIVQRTVKVGTQRSGSTGAILETSETTEERYDHLGRLVQVTEPSGSNGAMVTTDYTYDEGDRLTGVETSAGGTTQVRTFDYDRRGLLLSEQHPEKGAAVIFGDYDARGNFGRTFDGLHSLTYERDNAERVVAIRESSGPMRPLKTFTYSYDNPGDQSEWRLGKLVAASRFQVDVLADPSPNDVIFSDDFETGDLWRWSSTEPASLDSAPVKLFESAGDVFDVEIRETYTYGGKDGRLSQKDTDLDLVINDVPFDAQESFRQTWTYTDLGDLETVGYPRCIHSGCTSDGAGTPRTLTYAYARGELSNVVGYTTGISYDPDGLLAEIVHGNGVTTTQVNDPDDMARPASITVKRNTTPLWATGPYTYDGAGNITKIGLSWYLYDSVSRLVTGNITTDPLGTGSLTGQGYAYDAFGNIQAITGENARNIPTSSSTNQLSASSEYDSAGNLTSWNGNTYEYDEFNQMVRIHTGQEEWIYVYDADDERTWQIKIGSSPRLDRWTLRDLSGKALRTYKVTNASDWEIETDYIYRGTSLLAARTPDGLRYYHLDHLGTPRLITDSSGQQVAYHAYFPYGEEATDPFQDQETMKFTGHERDLNNPDGTGDDLDYMHARFCSPLTARFTSVDPVSSGDPLVPQSWNKYSYVRNNPLKLVDPNGATVASALRLIKEVAPEIQAASVAVEGKATPMELARLVFQENRNDFNLIPNDDRFAAPIGGPEIKNLGAMVLFAGDRSGSFGIVEMKTSTAGRLLGFGDHLNNLEKGIVAKQLLNDQQALILAAKEIVRIKEKFPNATTVQVLNAYNRGDKFILEIGSVARRSGDHLEKIALALWGDELAPIYGGTDDGE